mgnify:CR=1 FL=1
MTVEGFVWKSRPATSSLQGDGFFTVVGGNEIIVYEKATMRPVTGGMVVAESAVDLNAKVKTMLESFVEKWSALSPEERQANMVIAANTAVQLGWLR